MDEKNPKTGACCEHCEHLCNRKAKKIKPGKDDFDKQDIRCVHGTEVAQWEENRCQKLLPEKYGNVEFPLWLHAIPMPAWRAEVWEDGFSLWAAEGATHVEPLQPPAWGICLSPGSAESRPSNSPRVSVLWDFPGLGVIPHGAGAFTAL